MTSNTWDNLVRKNPVLGYIDANLRGASQVFFQNNPLTGGLILAGIFWGAHATENLGVAFGAVIGLLAATSMAIVLNLDRASLQQGFFGFNGILVGARSPLSWAFAQ